MNKTQIKTLLKPQIDTVMKSTVNIQTSKWNRSRAFYDMIQMVNWRKTPYRSFGKFLHEVLPDQVLGVAYTAISDYRSMVELGYTHAEMLKIGKKITYQKATIYARHLRRTHKGRKLVVKTFIENADSFTNVGVPSANGTIVNRVSLSLSAKHLHKLEVLLEPHGYVKTTNGIHTNISRAFESWLDTI